MSPLSFSDPHLALVQDFIHFGNPFRPLARMTMSIFPHTLNSLRPIPDRAVVSEDTPHCLRFEFADNQSFV